jgi:hypothetical protein
MPRSNAGQSAATGSIRRFSILLPFAAAGSNPVPIALLSLIVQIALIIHVLKTGREYWWILILLFLPGIGSLIYFFVEVLPSLRGNVAARRTARRVTGLIDPGRNLRQQTLEYERSHNVDSATRLATELIKDGKPDKAIEVCQQARSGIFEDDPTLLLALANAFFAKADYAQTVTTLDLLREKNPDFRSADGHLLYARALENDGRTDRALEEYEALARYYPGVEARVRQAQLQKRLGQTVAAQDAFRRIVEDARLAPRHFRKAQKEWIDIATRELANP